MMNNTQAQVKRSCSHKVKVVLWQGNFFFFFFFEIRDCCVQYVSILDVQCSSRKLDLTASHQLKANMGVNEKVKV